jgi:hypothetical protein
MECADDLVDKFVIAMGSQVEGFLFAAGFVKLWFSWPLWVEGCQITWGFSI